MPNLEEFHISTHDRCEEYDIYPVFCCKFCFVAIYVFFMKSFLALFTFFVWRKIEPKIVPVEKKWQIWGMVRSWWRTDEEVTKWSRPFSDHKNFLKDLLTSGRQVVTKWSPSDWQLGCPLGVQAVRSFGEIHLSIFGKYCKQRNPINRTKNDTRACKLKKFSEWKNLPSCCLCPVTKKHSAAPGYSSSAKIYF